MENDADFLFRQIQSRFPDGIHTLVGRSLGTYSIACALEKGLVIIGKADPRYEIAAPFLSKSHFIADDADHAMEIKDPIQSILRTNWSSPN